ncbi:MAG TPA: RagB/SusD family nutrient uptake outer membrane protein [Chitinophagaceae bacterium]|nr:RagB/SusD family nutrient uptake outer membrane protein [Chitinophagaceae bacterium]
MKLFFNKNHSSSKAISVLLVLLTLLAGCKKNFLDRLPLDSIVDESYWKTEEQLKLAVNGCYNNLKGKNVVDMENMGDNTIYPPSSDYQSIGAGKFDFTNGSINTEWVNLYAAIRRCNHFLENYQKATDITPAKLNQYVGEVKFLRAFMYAYLVFFFGDVPLITNTLDINDEQVFGPRAKKDDVLALIMNDLDSAIIKLPATYGTADLGRVTKGGALAWKSRVALFFGKWDVAATTAKSVMDLNLYKLYSNGNMATSYYDLFTYKGRVAAGANKETILFRPYVQDVSMHNMSRECQVPDQTSRFCPTKSLVDAYLCTDGLPVDKSPLYSEASYADIFKNRDPRMKQTILSPGGTWGGQDDGDADASPNSSFNSPKWDADKKGCLTGTGYYFTKYVEVSVVGAVSRDYNDIHLVRYAEILLNYAEAKLELGTLTQTDIDNTINLLRDRVGMKRMSIADIAANGLDLKTEIHRERRVELALEGQRYFDILRWKEGPLLAQDIKGMKKSLIEPYNQQYVATVPVDAQGYIVVNTTRIFTAPKNYLWPLPLTQTQKNPNLLPQNQGW